MANTKSAKKAARQTVRRTEANKARRSRARSYARKVEEAIASVKTLQGLLPICAYCKRIRDDRNYWQRVEVYVSEHTDATFTHGICPSCLEGAKAQLNT